MSCYDNKVALATSDNSTRQNQVCCATGMLLKNNKNQEVVKNYFKL